MIIHGPENVSGFAGLIARGQRALGLDAVSICHAQGPYKFDADYDFAQGQRPGSRSFLATLSDLLTQAEIVHIYFGRSFLGDSLLDARILKHLNRRVFYTFLGCDVRNKAVRLAQDTLNICHHCDPHLCSRNRLEALQAAAASGEACFVTTPDLLDELPHAIYTPLAVDTDLYSDTDLYRSHLGTGPEAGSDAPQGPESGPFRILHAPTDRLKKGTRFVIAAVDSLIRKGVKVELCLVEGLSHTELHALARTCHLAVDQLIAGVYGTFAAETMAMGLPTIARIDPRYRPRYPDDLPILHATPETLEAVLETCISGAVDLAQVGQDSRAFALAWHDYTKVAAQMSRYYSQQI